ncbi:aminoacyl-tRNA hydrolase, partial [Rhodoferax sp.]|uniref:aminoacyl-tRNA hydrolase n=1 Tax=Rhodoferax sp. TaxID=50421 RepID=UPI00271F2CB3
AELSEDQPGAMQEILDLVQPSIGIVTVVQDDHLSAFASRDHLAAEMGQLIASLPATGTAVLNADDPSVLAMSNDCAARIITYGTSLSASLRAEDISSIWPDRLRMTLVHGWERVRVSTQLCGAHWLSSVLGAIGGGLAVGLSLEECANGIADVAPFEGRMQPVTTPDEVTFIRDDFKAPLWTLDACFEFMRAAQANRKIMVFGTLSDYGSGTGASKKYAEVARCAQEVADVTIFVGLWASSALKARQPGEKSILLAFGHVRDAAEYVNSITRAGDLVLLKGTNKQDHLVRIFLGHTGDLACWQDNCGRQSFCHECPDRNRPSGPPAFTSDTPGAGCVFGAPLSNPHACEANEQIIVGLGNPETAYAGTPHNIGYDVVDQLAASLGLTWDRTPEAWIARSSWPEQPLCLVKIGTAMNRTGAGLKRLSQDMAFGPDQCILVYDDLDLPLGAVRARLRGSAGGHRGVASILEAFQTDVFRRVKVGVGHPNAMINRAEYVLTAFDESSHASVDLAITAAKARIVEMAKRP